MFALAACDETATTTVVIEDETADVVYVTNTIVQEDTTPDVEIYHTTEYVTLEDNTPDVVREYYSDAANLPMLEWQDTGGAVTMPKKFSDLAAASVINDADLIAITQGGTSKKATADLLRRLSFLDPRYGYIDHTDWVNDSGPEGEQNWASQTSGAGAIVGIGSIVGSRPGIARLQTGTTATGYAALHRGNTILQTGLGEMEFDIGVRVPTLSDGTDTFTIYAGFGDSYGSTDHANGIYFRYSHGLSSGNWERCTASGATRTQESTGVAVAAATWQHIGARLNAGATLVTFYINGVAAGTISTNIPTSAQTFSTVVKIVKSVGTTTRDVLIDYYQFRQRFTTAR
jgi:hypothetical protein